MNGDGLVDISGGTLNATASNVQVTVGYDNSPTPETNRVAELKIRDGGTANFTAGNKLMVGRWSDGIVTVEDGGTLNLADETVAIGYGPGTGTLNVTGGTINQTGNRFSIGAFGQGVGIVNMSGGTINADAIIMGDSATGTTNSGVSTFNQTGGTVNTTGGEARFGVRGDAVYNVGGGDSKLVDCLLDAGYEDITVLDISEKALLRAQKRLRDKASKVNWVVSDITTFKPDRPFDVWHDRAAFHFLTEAEQISQYAVSYTHLRCRRRLRCRSRWSPYH